MTDPDTPTADVPGPHGGRPIVTAGAPRGATEAVVLALHGRGATAQGVVNLFDPLYRSGVTFLAPEAERSRWYPHATTAPRERNEPHLSSAISVVEALVDHVVARFGVSLDHVVLTGFSQGACIAAEYVARNSDRYGGLAVLSGTLVGPDIDPAAFSGSLDGMPVLIGWGADDPHVGDQRARDTAAAFRGLDGDVTERRYDGVGHAVTDDEFDFLDALLDGLVGG